MCEHARVHSNNYFLLIAKKKALNIHRNYKREYHVHIKDKREKFTLRTNPSNQIIADKHWN